MCLFFFFVDAGVDLEDVRREFERDGVVRMRSVYVRDPDGNLIE